MPAFLVPVDSGQCLIPLEKAVVLIGRQADCDVSLTHSRKISRKHCCIAQVNNSFVVRDLGSTNGVFLNGARIQREAVIVMGDDLIIGDVHFRVQSEAPVATKQKTTKNGEEAGKPSKSKGAPGAARPPLPPVPVSSAPVPPLPGSRRSFAAPPSLDIPIAIPEGDLDFEVEETKAKPKKSSRKKAAPKNAFEDDENSLDDSNDDSPDGPFRLAP